jgi:hypothetical protein
MRPRGRATSLASAALALAATLLASPHARAAEPVRAEPVAAEATTARAAGKKAPPAPPLPVRLTVDAPSADPAWTLRVTNDGPSPIRLAADARLVSIELASAKKGRPATMCKAPAGLRPSDVRDDRALYLAPGATYVEAFDPRLYCFGANAEKLATGARVRVKLGFGPAPKFGAPRGPFVAEGTTHGDELAPLTELATDELTLAAPTAAPPPPITAAEGSVVTRDNGTTVVDANAPRLGLFVDRHDDAHAARDVAVTLRASNEGRRALSAVLRGRMLGFVVERLGHDGRVDWSTTCAPAPKPHASASELVGKVQGGRDVALSVLLAEVCPPRSFERPGLYRVSPRLDAKVAGEAAELAPWIGEALATQSVLVRVATGREPFYEASPAAAANPPPSAR